MKHKHSGERLLSAGRWVLSVEGAKMMERTRKMKQRRKAKKKNNS